MIGTIAIIGANVAGVTTAAELRRLGFEGRILLFDAEADPLYERPPLSKALLIGEMDQACEAPLLTAAELADLRLDLEFATPVRGIAPGRVELSSGRQVDADVMVIATGGRARRSPAFEHRDGVHVLRTEADALALRAALSPGAEVVVMGAGVVGCEVASSAIRRGCATTLVDVAAAPMLRCLGAEAAQVMATVCQQAGADMRFGAGVAAVEGRSHVQGLLLEDGERLPCDVLVVGIGMAANDELARGAGAEVDDGILVDDACRTSLPGVFAVGDVARRRAPGGGPARRVETIMNAQVQARETAAALLRLAPPAPQPQWFWSDQFGLNIQAVGEVARSDRVGWARPFDGREGVLLHFSDDRLCGAVSFNRGREMARLRRLLARGDDRTPEALLGDPDLAGAA